MCKNGSGMNKHNLSVALKCLGALLICLIACAAFVVASGLLLYVYPNFRDRRAIANCKDEEDVVAYFQREPEMVYRNMEQMTYYGWPLPTRPITNKMLVYTRTVCVKFVIGERTNGIMMQMYDCCRNGLYSMVSIKLSALVPQVFWVVRLVCVCP